MLSSADIEKAFGTVFRTAGGMFRCSEATKSHTWNYHFLLASESLTNTDMLLMSEGLIDDEFAILALDVGQNSGRRPLLEKMHLPDNAYGFDVLIIVPPSFHNYLSEHFAANRERPFLCIPAYQSEFSGDEDADTFCLLANRIVPHRDWRRFAHPKTLLRVENPATGGGTEGYVFGTFDLVMRELANMDGVAEGFIEIRNHRGETLELLSPETGQVVTICNFDDLTRTVIDPSQAADILWNFLT